MSSTLESKGFMLGKTIDEGSFSKVKLAMYKNKAIACKIINKNSNEQKYLEEFLPRELEICAKICHPSIVEVLSIFESKQSVFIFMRFAEKGSLCNYISKNGRCVEARAQLWFHQIAIGIEYLHNLTVAHRDLKCKNILVTANLNVKITDFGFSRDCVKDERGDFMSSTACGSKAYSAPEVLADKTYNPFISDIWSLGVILFVMLTESLPFNADDNKQLHKQQTKRGYKYEPEVLGQLSDDCLGMVNSLLTPEPKQRPNIQQVLASRWLLKLFNRKR